MEEESHAVPQEHLVQQLQPLRPNSLRKLYAREVAAWAVETGDETEPTGSLSPQKRWESLSVAAFAAIVDGVLLVRSRPLVGAPVRRPKPAGDLVPSAQRYSIATFPPST